MKDLFVFGTEREARELRRLYDVHAQTPLDLVKWAQGQQLGDIYVEPFVTLTAWSRDSLRKRQVKPGAVLIEGDRDRWQAALDRVRGIPAGEEEGQNGPGDPDGYTATFGRHPRADFNPVIRRKRRKR